MTKTYLLHLYHPDGPCRRYFFRSRVQAMKVAKAWLTEHFADRVAQCLQDIMKETDYFNPVYLAPLADNVPDDAHFLVRVGAMSEVSFPATEVQAWQLIDRYALAHGCPRASIEDLHTYLREQTYEPNLQILFYPVEFFDTQD